MPNPTRPVITGRTGAVAAGHYFAASAGVKMLAKGGNAVDAGVAAGFALAVLKPQENTLGGECPILIYSPHEKKAVSISGQGVAPAKATLEWFAERGISLIPGDGYLGATVPGMVGAYCEALRKYGRLSLEEVLAPATELAEKGFPAYGALVNSVASNLDKFLNEWPSSGAVFAPDGKAPEVGRIIRQPALANTLKRIAEAGRERPGEGREDAIQRGADFFYGAIADEMLEFVKNFPVKDASGSFHTALLEKEDFINYSTKTEEPARACYRGYEVCKCGPWTQGPVLLQQLKLLEGFGLERIGHNSAGYMHAVVECAKLAFDDREKYYGDPLFADVPLERLLSKKYADARRMGIDPLRANNEVMWAKFAKDTSGGYTGDTTHLDSADSEGFMMSATPSGGWIPSSPVIPETGFPLGTRGQMFVLDETHPNRLQPGKRPRTTLTPSLAFRDGRPWMAFGTPGGDCQDQWALQFLLNVVDFNMDLQRAMDAPSFYTCHFVNSFCPKNAIAGKVFAERAVCANELIKLQGMGHTLHLLEDGVGGQVCAVRLNGETGLIEAAASAKGDGQAYAAGW